MRTYDSMGAAVAAAMDGNARRAAELAATQDRGTCPVCERDDITIKRNGTLRHHVHAEWRGSSHMTPNGGRCSGSGQKPKEGHHA